MNAPVSAEQEQAAQPSDGSVRYVGVLLTWVHKGRWTRFQIRSDVSVMSRWNVSHWSEQMLEIEKFDLDEIANALSDQNMFDEHLLLVNPETGAIVLWTPDGGIDGTNPVDLDDLDLVAIDPLPSYVWYQDMANFVDLVSDHSAGRRLARAINGRGAFRRFKDELHEEYPHLLSAWYAFRDTRATRRAVEWLRDQSLISQEAADQFRAEHPDPDVP